jgi:hypothetical protein
MNWYPDVVTMGARELMVKPATRHVAGFFLPVEGEEPMALEAKKSNVRTPEGTDAVCTAHTCC